MMGDRILWDESRLKGSEMTMLTALTRYFLYVLVSKLVSLALRANVLFPESHGKNVVSKYCAYFSCKPKVEMYNRRCLQIRSVNLYVFTS